MKKIDVKTVISNPQIEGLGKRTVATLSKEFTDKQKNAIAKAVFYIICADEPIEEEDLRFFVQLCTDLKAENDIMKITTEMSDDVMFNELKNITDEQETYILSCLNHAADISNITDKEEVTIIYTLITHIRRGEKPMDIYTKIMNNNYGIF